MSLSYVVQIMHFRIEAVHQKSQEAFPVMEAMARVLYELCCLRDLLLVFNILLTYCQRFKCTQSLKDREGKRVNHLDACTVSPAGKAHLPLSSRTTMDLWGSYRTGIRSPNTGTD